MTTTLRKLQMATSSSECRPVFIKEEGLSIAPKSETEYAQQYEELAVTPAKSISSLHITSKEQKTIWYRGVFGSITAQEKWIRTSISGSRTVGKPVPAKKVLTMTSPFLKRAVELYFGASFASVPRALRVYQIINRRAPIFDMCRNGDLEGVQNELANGTVSPFVVDKYGWTLLHWAVIYTQPEICSLLLRLRLDPDRASGTGQKALAYLSNSSFDLEHRVADIARTLSQAQEEVSSTDIVGLSFSNRDPKIVEFLLSLDTVQQELILIEGGESHYPVLGAALRKYGCFFASDSAGWRNSGPTFLSEWESIIRRLLRSGVDVHAPVPRGYDFQPGNYPCTLDPYGNPLDELFMRISTAAEAKDAADAWLRILSTEGKDIMTYLEKEKALHDTRPVFTCPHWYFISPPRRLVFSLGEAATVYADWWIDPECSASLVRQEFKNMNMLADDGDLRWTEWQEYLDSDWKFVWPINYPRWSDPLEPFDDDVEGHATWKCLRQRAQERADRRWDKKAKKAARLNGTRTHTSMPGAWPEW